jgi:integrase
VNLGAKTSEATRACANSLGLSLGPHAGKARKDEPTRNRIRLRGWIRLGCACSIRVSTGAFVRIWRIVRKQKTVKFFVLNNQQWSESHLDIPKTSRDFYRFHEYDQLIVAGSEIDTTSHASILLGGDAGLRAGEMRALRWTDVDLDAGRLRVECSEWRGQITTTKGGRVRYVPMTNRLREALQRHRHLRSPLVLTRPDAKPMTEPALNDQRRSRNARS